MNDFLYLTENLVRQIIRNMHNQLSNKTTIVSLVCNYQVESAYIIFLLYETRYYF